MSLKRAAACIRKNRKFLITAHTNLEGDALGSELAFYRLLKKMGKSATIVNEDNLPYGYDFLPGVKNIKKFNKTTSNIEFDCFVILDCSDLTRCAGVAGLNACRKPVLNIDHHISNTRSGNINWVDPHSSSTSEMIYRLYKKLQVALDKDIATLLYVGILTDTGSFHYSNTTSFTHKAVSELLRYNLDIPQIYRKACENVPFEDIKLLSKILPTIRRDPSGRIVWAYIKREIFKKKVKYFDLSEYVLSLMRAIKDVEAVLLFKENIKDKDQVRVNLRSQGQVDVNKIAGFFGGGGHRTASGCTVKGKIEDVMSKVLKKVRESL